MNNLLKASLAATLLASTAAAGAAVITLDFEGIGNNAPVGNFYAAQGITFSPATLALVDSDAGGTGNFANEPTGDTIMFFTDANNAVVNVAGGFTTGFSFFYTSSTAALVNVYDGLNATGNLLGSLSLTAQYTDNCGGDPSGNFCNWTDVGVSFGGTAYSIDFGGTAGQTGYDSITFGSAIAGGGAVPEPASWMMLIAGFGLTGAAMRRRKALLAA